MRRCRCSAMRRASMHCGFVFISADSQLWLRQAARAKMFRSAHKPRALLVVGRATGCDVGAASAARETICFAVFLSAIVSLRTAAGEATRGNGVACSATDTAGGGGDTRAGGGGRGTG